MEVGCIGFVFDFDVSVVDIVGAPSSVNRLNTVLRLMSLFNGVLEVMVNECNVVLQAWSKATSS